MTTCPICGSHSIGKIGISRYFCADCCHEVVVTTKKKVAYYPSQEGEMRTVGKVKEVAACYAKTKAPRHALV